MDAIFLFGYSWIVFISAWASSCLSLQGGKFEGQGREIGNGESHALFVVRSLLLDRITSHDMKTSYNVKYSQESRETGFCIGPTASVLPEVRTSPMTENSQTGVSTNSVHTSDNKNGKHWYALRSTYGQERKAYDFIIAHGGTAFYPTISEERVKNGKKVLVDTSRIPNILFAYGTKEDVEKFVYDNIHLPYLRFYYEHHRIGNHITHTPLIVPEKQIESLRIICNVNERDTLFYNEEIRKFSSGETVRIIDGDFKGVIGKIARFKGQQRVAITIANTFTAITAYVPSNCLEHINEIEES